MDAGYRPPKHGIVPNPIFRRIRIVSAEIRYLFSSGKKLLDGWIFHFLFISQSIENSRNSLCYMVTFDVENISGNPERQISSYHFSNHSFFLVGSSKQCDTRLCSACFKYLFQSFSYVFHSIIIQENN